MDGFERLICSVGLNSAEPPLKPSPTPQPDSKDVVLPERQASTSVRDSENPVVASSAGQETEKVETSTGEMET